MHPLTPDLTKLTDEELGNALSNLQKRLSFAYRTAKGEQVQQLQMIMEDYFNEQNRRNRKMLEDLEKNNPNFRDIIDIS